MTGVAAPLRELRGCDLRLLLLSSLVVLYPFHFETSMFEVTLSAGDVVIGAIMLLWLGDAFGHSEIPRQGIVAGGFAAVALSSLAIAVVFGHSYVDVGSGVLALTKLAGSIAWFLAVFVVARGHAERVLPSTLLLSVGVASTVATYGIWQVIAGVPRATATFPNPNLLGNYLVFHVFLLAFLLLYPDDRGRLLPFAILPLSLGIVASGSRGAMIGAGIGIVITGLMVRRSSRFERVLRISPKTIGAAMATGASLVVLSAAFAATFAPTVTERIGRSFSLDARNLAGRITLWNEAVTAFLDSPIIGVGYGQYAPFTGEPHGGAHNVYLDTLAQTGILGLAALVGFVGLVVYDGHSLASRNVEIVAIVGAIAAVLGQGLVTDVDNFRSLWFAAGIVAAYYADASAPSISNSDAIRGSLLRYQRVRLSLLESLQTRISGTIERLERT